MKKIILFFILFVISAGVYGQTEYGILVKSKIKPRSVWPSGENDGLHDIIIGSAGCSIYIQNQFDDDYKYCFSYVTDEPSEIIFMENINTSNLCGYIRKTMPYNKKTFQANYFMGCFADSDIMGIHLPPPGPNNSRCIEDVINLSSGWNWQYRYNGTDWVSFPEDFQMSRGISFKIKDLLGYDGKAKIDFRTGYETQFTNFITYNIIPCSPKLVDTPATEQTSCIYNNDGKLFCSFERPLNVSINEYFLLTLIDPNDPTKLYGSKYVYSKDMGDSKTYVWTDLSAGTYKLRYQTYQNNGTKPASDETSLLPFTVTAPKKLTFSIALTDPRCYTDKGDITITATGGTPPYFYFLNDGTKTQFENSHTTDAAGLHKGIQTIIKPTGTYIIKVIDNKECIEK